MPGPDPALWAVRPALLADGAVHVWRADLTTVAPDLCELLGREERARAERILDERTRQLWMRSRGVLRALLGRYLRQDPRTLRFATSALGKPSLLEDPGAAAGGAQPVSSTSAQISFNLSHSGGRALYAFATSSAVGVDVELARRSIDAVGLARRLFGAAVAERLAALDPRAREREFLRAWVRHEAERKCLGTGIGAGDGAAGGHAAWIAELEIGPRAAAAVAAAAAPRELRCWDWS